jgi:hypothetical protein
MGWGVTEVVDSFGNLAQSGRGGDGVLGCEGDGVGSFCAGGSWLHWVASGCTRLQGSGFVLRRGVRVGARWNRLERFGARGHNWHAYPRRDAGRRRTPERAREGMAPGKTANGVVRAWCLRLLGGLVRVGDENSGGTGVFGPKSRVFGGFYRGNTRCARRGRGWRGGWEPG